MSLISTKTLVTLREKLGSSAWLVSSMLVSSIAALGLAKLIALYIDPAVYGDYDLVLGVVMLVTSLVISPVIRFFKFAFLSENPFVLARFTWWFLSLAILISVIPGGLVFFLWRPEAWMAGVAVVVFLSAQSFLSLSKDYVNLKERHREYSWLEMLPALATIAFFLLPVYQPGFRSFGGLWVVYAAGMLPAVFYGARRVWNYWPEIRLAVLSASEKARLTDRLVKYGRPLAVLAVFGWVINRADRYIINWLLDSAEVGWYAAGYGLGSKIVLLGVTPFLLLIQPEIYNKLSGSPDKTTVQSANRLVFQYAGVFCAGSAVVIPLLFVFRNETGFIFLSSTYANAFNIFPVIAAGYVALAVVHLLEVKFYAAGFTRYVLVHNIVGAMVNVPLNFLLIPVWGITGAAVSTGLTFVLQMVLVWILFFRMDRHVVGNAIQNG